MSEFLTIKQLSELLKIPVNTLYSWTSQRKIPYKKVNGYLLRFKLQDIERWLDGAKVEPTETGARLVEG